MEIMTRQQETPTRLFEASIDLALVLNPRAPSPTPAPNPHSAKAALIPVELAPIPIPLPTPNPLPKVDEDPTPKPVNSAPPLFLPPNSDDRDEDGELNDPAPAQEDIDDDDVSDWMDFGFVECSKGDVVVDDDDDDLAKLRPVAVFK
ncbi:hypothetical protein HDU76_005270, partial [Blyttiomyces sp. JEL0837]